MKTTPFKFLPTLLALLFLSACATTSIYGVPPEVWSQMSDEQRQEAIKGHNERAKLDKERSLARERRAAADAERRRLEAEMAAQQRRTEVVEEVFVEEIPPRRDRIQVTIRGGTMRFHGKHRSYRPVSFNLAEGERKQILFQSHKRAKPLKIWVAYREGSLIFDDAKQRRRSTRFVYAPSWKKGARYENIDLGKYSSSDGRGLNILVKTARRYR
jgi:hypothetical protein